MKFSKQGYKRNSPDKNRPYNIIPSGNITMNNVPHPVFGTDNFGTTQLMLPGIDYQFPGNAVFEIPLKMQDGGQNVRGLAKSNFGNDEDFYSPNTTDTDKLVYLADLTNYAIGSGLNPASTKQGRILYSSGYKLPNSESDVQKLYNTINIFNARPDVKNLTPEQRLDLFYNKLYSNDKDIDGFKAKVKTLGYGPVSFFRGAKDMDLQGLQNNNKIVANNPPQNTLQTFDIGGEPSPQFSPDSIAVFLAGQDQGLQNFLSKKNIASKDNQNPFGVNDVTSVNYIPKNIKTNNSDPESLNSPHTYSSPFWGVAGVTGLSFLANTLENWNSNQKQSALMRKQGMTDNFAPVLPASRGDYTVNEEYFRPNQYTPVQFGAIPTAQNGGYFDSPVELSPLASPLALPEIQINTDNSSVPNPVEIENFKSGINEIELSGNRNGYNIEHKNGSSAFGPFGFLANPKAALGSIYKKYYNKEMTFKELVARMKKDGDFQEHVMDLQSQDLLNRYHDNPFAAALEHFAGSSAASKFLKGTLDLNSTPGGNNVSYKKYLNEFSKGAGLAQRFQEGGEYSVTPEDLLTILQNGGEVEFI